MTYPILYSQGHTDFNNLGLGIMVDTVSATVTEELNGKFELDIVYKSTGSLINYMVKNGVIKVNTGDQENQLFVIKKVTKPLKGNALRIRTYEKSGKREIGVIADEAPDNLLLKDEKGDMLSLYDYSSIAIKAIQELTEEVSSLKQQMKEMEKQIA